MKVKSFIWLVCAVPLCAQLAMAQETPTAVVAAAVRDAGYECKKPAGITAEPKRSGADEKAWIVKCETASYRVRFMGDSGAKVEPLSGP